MGYITLNETIVNSKPVDYYNGKQAKLLADYWNHENKMFVKGETVIITNRHAEFSNWFDVKDMGGNVLRKVPSFNLKLIVDDSN